MDNEEHHDKPEIKYTIRSHLDEKMGKVERVPIAKPVEDVEKQEVEDNQVDFADFLNIDLNVPGAKELMAAKD